jgi:hypothetical protein
LEISRKAKQPQIAERQEGKVKVAKEVEGRFVTFTCGEFWASVDSKRIQRDAITSTTPQTSGEFRQFSACLTAAAKFIERQEKKQINHNGG